MKSKVILPPVMLNKLVKAVAKKQNTKNKLQAGEIREMVKAVLSSVPELNNNEKVFLLKQLLAQ